MAGRFGHAGYHRDPITGHCMTDAFRDAELLADALDPVLLGDLPEATALAAYEQARDLALADTYRLTRALARFPRPDRFVELQISALRGPRTRGDRARLPTGTRPAAGTSRIRRVTIHQPHRGEPR